LIVDTRRLFCRLLRVFDVATVCDVGSMDGADALRFRRELPAGAILALEPNPRNFALMAADEQLRRHGIRVFPVAASDRASTAEFFVVHADYSPGSHPAWRGMSSLHRRADSALLAETVQVSTVRLDELLVRESLSAAPIALWVDTEGMAYEVLLGATGLLARTVLIHVEVETVACIGVGQRLLPDVERILHDAGFVLLATDWPATSPQLNELFVRADVLRAKGAQVGWHLAKARLSRGARRAVRSLIPLPLRRLLVRRLAAPRRHRVAG
jgi:FkbM family methyltransferase